MGKENGKPIEEIGLLQKRIVELEALKTGWEKAEQVATEAKELGENIIDALRNPLVVMDAGLKIMSVNRSFYETFKVETEETLSKCIYDLGNRQWDIPRLRDLLENILLYNASFDNYVIEHNFPSIGKRLMILNARRIPRPPAKPRIILLAMEDITDIARIKMSFERIAELGFFSNATKDKEHTIIMLKEEVDALLGRLGERLKYNK